MKSIFKLDPTVRKRIQLHVQSVKKRRGKKKEIALFILIQLSYSNETGKPRKLLNYKCRGYRNLGKSVPLWIGQ